MTRRHELLFGVAAGLGVWLLLVVGTHAPAAATDDYEVEIGGEPFLLEVAADAKTRYLGLGGRESIAANGGMIFVFPRAEPRRFVMRDCLIPIDILFLDSDGAITATYTMQPEEPQGRYESDQAYAQRLTHYSSLTAAQFVIELRAGTVGRLGLTPGDSVALDAPRLLSALR